MTINSLAFLLFFLPVFVLYFSVCRKHANWQNVLLLIASYFFYAYANWKAVPILLVSTIVTYYLGVGIQRAREDNPRKASLLTNLGVWLGILLLLYFKYLNFFISSFEDLFTAMGFHVSHHTFKIILPVGISFFTFKLISYLVEIHRRKMDAERDFIRFATYVAFFPTILSGPIDRPKAFLKQLATAHQMNWADIAEGSKRVLWGMFKKMCVADVICGYTDAVFNNYAHHNATSLTIAAVLYSFQLYADFSGYSDMAIGVGRILGIKSLENFRVPFFAVNITEYWKRWHMTLTSWLTDYVFTPLNLKFRNLGMWGLNLAVMINLLAIGAWHGANWTFILFGFYHGCCLIFNNLIAKRRKLFEKAHGLKKNTAYRYARMAKMFLFVTFGNIIFRSNTITDFLGYLSQYSSGFLYPYVAQRVTFIMYFPPLLLMLFKDWKDEEKFNIHFFHSPKWYVQAVSMALLLAVILLEGEFNGPQFIYFQF